MYVFAAGKLLVFSERGRLLEQLALLQTDGPRWFGTHEKMHPVNPDKLRKEPRRNRRGLTRRIERRTHHRNWDRTRWQHSLRAVKAI